MAYLKLDTNILTSSLWINRDDRDIFLTTLIMAQPYELKEPTPTYYTKSKDPENDPIQQADFIVPPGWYGLVRAASVGIIRQALTSQTEGFAALKRLEEPDLESRSQEHEGRRLVRINGGYIVLNYIKFRDHDYANAQRQQNYRDRKKRGTHNTLRDVTSLVTPVTQAVGSRQEAVGRKATDLKPSATQPKQPRQPQTPAGILTALRKLIVAQDQSRFIRRADVEPLGAKAVYVFEQLTARRIIDTPDDKLTYLRNEVKDLLHELETT